MFIINLLQFWAAETLTLDDQESPRLWSRSDNIRRPLSLYEAADLPSERERERVFFGYSMMHVGHTQLANEIMNR